MEASKLFFALITLMIVILGIGIQIANDPWWVLRKRLWTKGEIWDNNGVFKNPEVSPEPFIWQHTK